MPSFRGLMKLLRNRDLKKRQCVKMPQFGVKYALRLTAENQLQSPCAGRQKARCNNPAWRDEASAESHSSSSSPCISTIWEETKLHTSHSIILVRLLMDHVHIY